MFCHFYKEKIRKELLIPGPMTQQKHNLTGPDGPFPKRALVKPTFGSTARYSS